MNRLAIPKMQGIFNICKSISVAHHIKKVKVKVAQSRPTLCDPMDYTVHGTLQARILE